MGSIFRPTYVDRHGAKRESAKWWIQYYSRGRKVRESADTVDYEDARTFLKKREGEAADKGPIYVTSRKVTFADLARDEVNDYKINERDTTKDLQTRLDLHILPFFGKSRANNIRPADITAYVVERQTAGAENGTINRELTAIKRAFSLGLQSGKIASAPYIKMLKENNVRQGFFERDQLEAVLKKLEGRGRECLRPMFRFAYITGWRIRSEVKGIKWPQVDFQAGTVRLEPGTTKNKEGRQFPFTEELRAILEEQWAEHERMKTEKGKICPYVFNRKGRPIGEFKRSWKTACDAASLPGRIPHDFRRTAVRNLTRAGVPETVAMKLTGHRTRSVFDRYNITSDSDLVTAAQKLDEFAERTKTRTKTGRKPGEAKK
jgi:integrase